MWAECNPLLEMNLNNGSALFIGQAALFTSLWGGGYLGSVSIVWYADPLGGGAGVIDVWSGRLRLKVFCCGGLHRREYFNPTWKHAYKTCSSDVLVCYLGFSWLRPLGVRVCRVCIQFVSTFSLMGRVKGAVGGAFDVFQDAYHEVLFTIVSGLVVM